MRRILRAIVYSFAGLKHAFLHETAVRQEIIALIILVPVSAVIPVSDIEHLLLVLPLMLLVVVELLNSAIERAVDRISEERHPLAAQAKDMGSAAVFVTVLMAGLCWTVIAGPVAMGWIGRTASAPEEVPIVGSWRLMSAVDSLPDGSTAGWMGERPHGLLVYTASGGVSLQFMREPRSQLPAGIDSATLLTTEPYRSLTAEQMRDVYLGYYAYTGRYAVNATGDSITHRIESSLRPPEVGRVSSRAFRIEGERLILGTHLMVDGAPRHRVLTWQREEGP